MIGQGLEGATTRRRLALRGDLDGGLGPVILARGEPGKTTVEQYTWAQAGCRMKTVRSWAIAPIALLI